MSETPLDPHLEICDPHHHLWEYPTSTYLVDELLDDVDGLDVTATVFVECGSAYRADGPLEMRPVGETEWVASLARDGVNAGIIGMADLALGDAVEPVLEAHVAAGDGRFRGVRHVTAYDADDRIRTSHTNPPPELMRSDTFARGIAALGRAELSFEAWLYFPQLPELVELARAHPDVRIVLDHLGGPIGIGPYAGRRDENLATWRSAMAEVASCPNVDLKLGGIGMPIFGLSWHKDERRPTSEDVAREWGGPIRWCIETFGIERCMFESNFPVDKASIDYVTLWNAFVRMAEGCSDAERAALFRDNARRIYALGKMSSPKA